MAQPVLKWAGGKRGILPALHAAMPSEFSSYYEPFIGGGALFFSLDLAGHKAHLSDINADLIEFYLVLRDNPVALRASLDRRASEHSEEYYYHVRAQHHLPDPIERASRFLFINKAGYNGLVRYNRKGEINTPWGHKKNPITLYDPEGLIAASDALKGADLQVRSYSRCQPRRGSFVYLDPPYHKTYDGYTSAGFGDEEHRQLAEWCRTLDSRGVKFLLSNSNTDYVRSLYEGFELIEVEAPRTISCKADGRQAETELLVRNYG